MINFFVETKIEYTTQLVNVLTPLIFEGLQSIYTEALKVSNETNNVLKVFQSFLKRIPKWNQDMIKEETDRIMNNSKSFSWLPDLVKATVKSNIIVLTYNPGYKNQTKIDPKYYKEIKIEDFIHKVYIECARELWNNPYLMYHLYPAIELKRNQRDTNSLVKDSIREAIRKLLPVKQILEIYLGEELEGNLPNDDFDKNITEADEKNIQKLINRALHDEPTRRNSLSNKLEYKPESLPDFKLEKVDNNLSKPDFKLDKADNNLYKPDNNLYKSDFQNGGGNDKDLNTKILDILNKPTSLTSTDSTSDNYGNKKNEEEKNNIENKIKHILEKDLGEADLDTSLSYKAETNDKDYQEIFSNKQAKQESVKNDKDKDSSKSKRKFFNNYLNF